MRDPLFFWLGLAAVAGFFLGITLLVLALFAATPEGRRRLTWGQSAVLAALLLMAAASARLLLLRLAPFGGPDPPIAASAVDGAMREILSLVLLGLALTLNSLLTAFGWIRLGRAGNAMRALVWALPALRLVLAGSRMLDAFDTGRQAETAPDPAAASAAFRAAAEAATSAVVHAAELALALFALALLASLIRRRVS